MKLSLLLFLIRLNNNYCRKIKLELIGLENKQQNLLIDSQSLGCEENCAFCWEKLKLCETPFWYDTQTLFAYICDFVRENLCFDDHLVEPSLSFNQTVFISLA